jgi:hypothetical protein
MILLWFAAADILPVGSFRKFHFSPREEADGGRKRLPYGGCRQWFCCD